jgi:hypothetical protein
VRQGYRRKIDFRKGLIEPTAMEIYPLFRYSQTFHYRYYTSGTTDHLARPYGCFGAVFGAGFRQTLPRVEQMYWARGTGVTSRPSYQSRGAAIEDAALHDSARYVFPADLFSETHQISLADRMNLSEGKNRAVGLIEFNEHSLIAFSQSA